MVYANLTDPGGSGVASALADVSALAAGMSSVPLVPCVAALHHRHQDLRLEERAGDR